MDDLPGCPTGNSGCVDLRDVADLRLWAMTKPAASGERVLAIAALRFTTHPGHLDRGRRFSKA